MKSFHWLTLLLAFALPTIVPAQLPQAASVAASSVTVNAAQLNGFVNPIGGATYWFQWGALTDADSSTNYAYQTSAQTVAAGNSVIFVTNSIAGLITLNAPYHFRLVASNSVGVVYGGEQRFIVGHVVAWGAGLTNANDQVNYGQSIVPASASNVVAVAANDNYSMAVRRDGAVVAWGANYFGQLNVPPIASNVVAVAAGNDHCLALRRNGTVVAWGNNYAGQANVPAGLSNIVAVAAGSDYNLALRRDGTITAWGGGNSYGQINVPAGLSNIVAIAAGFGHNLALRSDGTVVAWGAGMTNDPNTSASFGQSLVPVGLSNVIAVAAGGDNSLALRRDGTLVAWGYNSNGQTNVPAGLSNVVTMAVSSLDSVALRRDGMVKVWANNFYGQTNVPAGFNNVVAVAGGYNHNLVLTAVINTTTTLTSSTNPVIFGQPFTLTATVSPAAASGTIIFYDGATAISTNALTNGVARLIVPGLAAGNHNLTATYTGGDSYVASTSAVITQIITALLPRAASLAATLVATSSAQLNGFVTPNSAGTTYRFQYGAITNVSSATNYTYMTGAKPLATGTQVIFVTDSIINLTANVPYHFRLVVSNSMGVVYGGEQRLITGMVVAWGAGLSNNPNTGADYGQASVPVNLSNVVAVAAGGLHSVALRNDGTVATWGDNFSGETNVPAGLNNVAAVAVGFYHTVALRNDGTVIAWGDNSYGAAAVPTGLRNVVAVAAGGHESMALRSDGTVVAWGEDDEGQTDVPAGLSNVVAVATGGLHSLALRNDGTVMAWGYNGDGETDVPAGLSNVVAVAANGFHNLALRNDGTVVTWGWDDYNESQTILPIGLTNVVTLAAGVNHNLALRRDGTVMAWGDNYYGQAMVPANLSNVVALAAGGFHNLALTAAVNTMTTLASSTNPSVFSQPLILTATVNPAPPVGTVIFYDGATSISTNALNTNGVAILDISTVAAGTHKFTATFLASGSYLSSTSMPFTQTVNQVATTNVLTSSVNPSVSGQSVIFTANLNAIAPGRGLPTGRVTFFSGTTNLGMNPLVNGVASITNWTLPAGTNPITAVYDGDTNFTGSTSLPLTQTVVGLTSTQVLATIAVDTSSARYRQTGLMQQSITVSNITAAAYPAVRVTLQLSAGQKQLGVVVYNATGTDGSGNPYLESDFAVPPHGSVTFTVEYYVPDRTTIPNPTISVTLVTAAAPPAIPAGTSQPVLRQSFVFGSAFLVEFQTVKGASYYVLYSTNMVDWTTILPVVIGTGSQVQWLDQGPPQTAVVPGADSARYYRVIKVN